MLTKCLTYAITSRADVRRRVMEYADGIYGMKTVSELQKMLGVKEDGKMGPDTVRSFFSRLQKDSLSSISNDEINRYSVALNGLRKAIYPHLDEEIAVNAMARLRREFLDIQGYKGTLSLQKSLAKTGNYDYSGSALICDSALGKRTLFALIGGMEGQPNVAKAQRLKMTPKSSIVRAGEETTGKRTVIGAVPRFVASSTRDLREITDSEEYRKLEPIFGKKVSQSLCKWGKRYGVDPYLIASLIVAEQSSIKDKDAARIIGARLKRNPNFYSEQISKVGVPSYGLMQLTQKTFTTIKSIGGKATADDTFEGVISDYDKSIMYAVIYLRYCSNNVGYKTNEDLAKAYNAGPSSFVLKNSDMENLSARQQTIKRTATLYAQKVEDAYARITGSTQKGRIASA